MKYIFLNCFLVLAFISCSQTKATIVQSKAFYYLRTPGALLVDESGNPVNRTPDTITTIYLEVKGKIPVLKTAWMHGKSYTIIPTPVKVHTIDVGKKKDSDELITFTASKENSIIALELAESKQIPLTQKVGKDEILIKGIYNKKNFFYRVRKIVPIASPEFM